MPGSHTWAEASRVASCARTLLRQCECVRSPGILRHLSSSSETSPPPPTAPPSQRQRNPNRRMPGSKSEWLHKNAIVEFRRNISRGKAAAAAEALAAAFKNDARPPRHCLHSLLDLYARRAQANDALEILHEMKTRGPPPNAYTYGYCLSATKRSAALHRGEKTALAAAKSALDMLREMKHRGIEPTEIVYNEIMDIIGKSGADLNGVFRIYDERRLAGHPPDPRVFSILLKACAAARQPKRAEDVVHRLMTEAGFGKPPTSAWNGLLSAYASVGNVDGAFSVWQRMIAAGVVPDVHTERQLVKAFASHPQMAAELVAEAREMQRHVSTPGINVIVGESDAVASRSYQKRINLDSISEKLSAMQIGLLRGTSEDGKVVVGDMMKDTETCAQSKTITTASTDRKETTTRRLQSDLLLLDLHGHSKEAARMALLRRLEALIEAWPRFQAQEAAGDSHEKRPHTIAPTATSNIVDYMASLPPLSPSFTSQKDRSTTMPGLSIIVGAGRGSVAGVPVLRRVVSEFLEEQGLASRGVLENPGRLEVPWPILAEFVAEQRENMQRDAMLAAARLRYGVVAAAMVTAASAALILPRLTPWL